MKINVKQIVSVVGCAVLMAGCAQQQQQGRYKLYTPASGSTSTVSTSTQAPAPTSTAAAVPAPKPGTVQAFFPSGRPEGSGLLVEKTTPTEILAGQPFEYSYKVSNLTDATLENVMLMDRVSGNFTPGDAMPKANSVRDGIATWDLGALGPKASKVIVVKGKSGDDGVVTTCGYATYNPVICQDIRILKASVQLTKNEPGDVTICDTIPAVITVKNTGSSQLTGVKIEDNLPQGMTSDGKGNLTFDVGNLAPGESKEFKYNATATATGKLVNKARVTTAQGVSAEATAATTVHKPVLAITCKAAEQQFMGRKFDVCYTVSNTGDTAAKGTRLEVAVPAGLEVASAGSGKVDGGKVVFDLGSVDVNNPQNVCVTFVGNTAGNFSFTGTAKGACATAVSTTCNTKVTGQAAILLEKWDDPDPVSIGSTTTFTVRITNQGSAPDNNIQVIVEVAPELVPVSTSPGKVSDSTTPLTAGTISGQTVTMPLVPTLAPKASVTFQVVAKGVHAGDGHTLFKLSSDVLKAPISAQESTHVY